MAIKRMNITGTFMKKYKFYLVKINNLILNTANLNIS